MNRNFNFILIISITVIFYSCLPDRMPSAPVEIDRPLFGNFNTGESNLVVPLNNPVNIYFNEPMDLNSFAPFFKVESVSGEIKGSFSYGQTDTIVVFTPATNYMPAEYYEVTMTGGIRDVNGNSVTSPVGEDIPQSTWFFTSGDYSKDGFPYVFVRDKSNRNNIYRIHNLNQYTDSLILPGTADYQTSAVEVDPVTDKIYIVNLKVSDGLITVLDPATFSVTGQMTVGLGPTNIKFNNDKAYVTNLSAKSFSVLNLNTMTTENTYVFPDGFRPKDVVFSHASNSLYFYSSVNNDIKKVDAGDFSNTKIFPSGLNTRPSDIEITKDGRFLYMVGTNSSILSIVDLETETASTIDLGYQYLSDGVMGKDFFYLSYFRGVGGENFGGILKIDLVTKEIKGHLEWEHQVDQLKLTASEELIYAVTPVNSTVQVVETKAMHNITSAQLTGSLKFLAVTNKNY